ncbi:MAG TPA: hypothetical protein VF532_02940 [Candidatus Angelobacter sp.]
MPAGKRMILVLVAFPAVLMAQRASGPVPARAKPAAAAHTPVTTASPGLTSSTMLAPASSAAKPTSALPARPSRPMGNARAVIMPLRRTFPNAPQIATAQIATPAPAPHPAAESPEPVAAPMPSADPGAPVTVEFALGKLTVVANHAELGKVLRLIAVKISAEIQVAPEVAAEPAVVRLGPGSPSEVLDALLSSPTIDFMILGSEEGRVQRVLVSRRASFAREPLLTAMTAQQEPAAERQEPQLAAGPQPQGEQPSHGAEQSTAPPR